jgi:hypothetical protein
MTQAAHIEDETRPSLIGLALAPLVLLCLWFTQWAERLQQLKATRRACIARNAARFDELWPQLRLNEWMQAQILSEGVRRLPAGEDLDLDSIPAMTEIPDSFQPLRPRSARDFHRRAIALAAFHADPAEATRRAAARIRAPRAAAPVAPVIDTPSPAIAHRIVATAQRVRAPPQSGPGGLLKVQ